MGTLNLIMLVWGCAAVILTLLNFMQCIATRTNHRPPEARVRASSTIVHQAHVFMTLACLGFAGRAFAFVGGTHGVYAFTAAVCNQTSVFLCMTWLAVVADQTLASSFATAEIALPRCIRPSLTCIWLLTLILTPTTLIGNFITNDATFWLVQYAAWLAYSQMLTWILIGATARLRQNLINRDSRLRSKRKLASALAGHIRLVIILTIGAVLATCLYIFLFILRYLSNAPYFPSSPEPVSSTANITIAFSVVICGVITAFFWVKISLAVHKANEYSGNTPAKSSGDASGWIGRMFIGAGDSTHLSNSQSGTSGAKHSQLSLKPGGHASGDKDSGGDQEATDKNATVAKLTDEATDDTGHPPHQAGPSSADKEVSVNEADTELEIVEPGRSTDISLDV